MKRKFIPFAKIGQYNQTVRAVVQRARYAGKDTNGDAIYDSTAEIPTITFKGSTKLHGTNAGVVMNRAGDMWAQSRSHPITVEHDNCGFAFFVQKNEGVFHEMFASLSFEDADYVAIFGEWCGGNIQKGVAICELSKRFVVFDVKMAYDEVVASEDGEATASRYLTDDKWQHLKSVENAIYNILDFPTWTIDIDFNHPAQAQNELVEITDRIEAECPVGKAFDVSGCGEGAVWKANMSDMTHRFKVKGKKHSASKVKTIAPVDPERLKNVMDFVEYAVTENRLNQGIEQVFTTNGLELDIKKLGDFLNWVRSDIFAEELDALIASNLTPKDVGKDIATAARIWFMKKWSVV